MSQGPKKNSPSNRSPQSKNWCFTINNYTESDIELLAAVECKYMVYGKEVGDTGTPHLQGYVVFAGNKRLAGMKKIHATAHWEKSNGTTEQNVEYCTKDGLYVEHGIRPKSRRQVAAGNAERYAKAVDIAINGDINEIDPELRTRYYGVYKQMKKDNMKKPEPLGNVCGLWIYGPSGSGKTHAVVNAHPGRYCKPLSKWWDGYQGEDVVHIDEINPSNTPYMTAGLKLWADKWPFHAEIKGSATQLRPKQIIVTSNYSIDEMGFDPVDLPAIKRRYVQVFKDKQQDIILLM